MKTCFIDTMTVKIFMFLLIIHSVQLEVVSRALLVGDVPGYIAPLEPVIPLGGSVTLNCTLDDVEPMVPEASAFLYFSLLIDNTENRLNDHIVLNDRTIQITLENITFDEATVVCFNETGDFGGRGLVDLTNITTKALPVTVENVTCVSDSFEDMACSWCSSHNSDYTYNFAYLTSEVNATWSDCPCYASECICFFCGNIKKLEYGCEGMAEESTFVQFLDYNIRVVTSLLGLEDSAPYLTTISADLSIVKLRPVKNLQATPVNSSVLNITWAPPDEFEENVFLIVFEIYAYPEFVYEATLKWQVVGQLQFFATNLEAYTRYNISVRARTLTSPYWSDDADTVARTTAYAACNGPPLPKGSYRTSSCLQPSEHCYSLQIFWQEYNASCQNGVLRGYGLRAMPHNGGTAANSSADSAGFSGRIELHTEQRYNVCVTAYTADSVDSNVTYPSPDSCLYIEEHNRWPNQLQRVYAEISEDESKLHLFFEMPSDLTSYAVVVFACQPHTVDKTDCQSSPETLVLDNATSPINISHTTQGQGYGLSVIKLDSSQSSGLQQTWITPCLYNGSAGTPSLYEIESSKNSLVVHWQLLSCDGETHQGHVNYYATTLEQNDKVIQEKYSDDGWQTEEIFKDLKSGSKYNVLINAVTRAGPGPSSDRSVSTEQDEAAVWKIITPVLVLFIMICASIAFFLYRREKVNKPLPITLPDVSDQMTNSEKPKYTNTDDLAALSSGGTELSSGPFTNYFYDYSDESIVLSAHTSKESWNQISHYSQATTTDKEIPSIDRLSARNDSPDISNQLSRRDDSLNQPIYPAKSSKEALNHKSNGLNTATENCDLVMTHCIYSVKRDDKIHKQGSSEYHLQTSASELNSDSVIGSYATADMAHKDGSCDNQSETQYTNCDSLHDSTSCDTQNHYTQLSNTVPDTAQLYCPILCKITSANISTECPPQYNTAGNNMVSTDYPTSCNTVCHSFSDVPSNEDYLEEQVSEGSIDAYCKGHSVKTDNSSGFSSQCNGYFCACANYTMGLNQIPSELDNISHL